MTEWVVILSEVRNGYGVWGRTLSAKRYPDERAAYAKFEVYRRQPEVIRGERRARVVRVG